MSSPVRRQRTAARSVPGSGTTIGVTGATETLGAAAIEALAASGAGVRALRHDSSQHSRPDLTGIDIVVHLVGDRSLDASAAERRSVNVRGTETLLEAAASSGVRRVILVTSALVYGASTANAVPLDEDDSLLLHADDGLVGDWLAVEALARDAGVDVCVVRPAQLIGAVSDVLLPGLFGAMRLLALRDGRCHWQFCHTDDLISALVLAATLDLDGPITVGCDGWLERADVERIANTRSIVLPVSVARATAARLHRIGTLRMPASDLDYLMHPCVIGAQRLTAVGWRPRWTNEAALSAHLASLPTHGGSRFGRVDATRAAAGATLAIVGSLAIARARSRNKS